MFPHDNQKLNWEVATTLAGAWTLMVLVPTQPIPHIPDTCCYVSGLCKNLKLHSLRHVSLPPLCEDNETHVMELWQRNEDHLTQNIFNKYYFLSWANCLQKWPQLFPFPFHTLLIWCCKFSHQEVSLFPHFLDLDSLVPCNLSQQDAVEVTLCQF